MSITVGGLAALSAGILGGGILTGIAGKKVKDYVSNAASLSSDNSSDHSGLSISDSFADDIRALQKEAAEQQQAYQTQSAERAMQFSAEEAEKNRQWQEHMSSTAYQRAVSDMKAAGINPILAAGGSSFSASTPAGSSASGVAQAGSQAQVSDKNSGLEALEVYIQGMTSAVDVISNFIPSAGKAVGKK